MKTPLQYSKSGLALTERFEQCRLVAYKPLPTDPWTLGFGHTGPDVHEGQTCTQQQTELGIQ